MAAGGKYYFISDVHLGVCGCDARELEDRSFLFWKKPLRMLPESFFWVTYLISGMSTVM